MNLLGYELNMTTRRHRDQVEFELSCGHSIADYVIYYVEWDRRLR